MKIESSGRRHLMIESGDNRFDERCEIHVRMYLSREGLNDRVLDRMLRFSKLEHVFDLSGAPKILGRVRVCSRTAG